MKKVISFILIVCSILCCVSSISSAAEEPPSCFVYENGVEITVYNDNLSYKEKKIIADFVAYGEFSETYSTYGLACIFGHKLEKTYVDEVIHNSYSTSPKCLKNTYIVEMCTRSSCDYITKELSSSKRISTCHG